MSSTRIVTDEQTIIVVDDLLRVCMTTPTIVSNPLPRLLLVVVVLFVWPRQATTT